MGEKGAPDVYSIAAHRGFADALVAGLVPRYSDGDLGLAPLTLLVPSSRAARTISEAFIRHSGQGLLMPRMVAIGDLDLDEALGSLLDPLDASDIPPAIEPTRRWLELANILEGEMAELGKPSLRAAARLRMARELAQTMDRLLVEEKTPEDLIDGKILDLKPSLAKHWDDAILLFARVLAKWRFWLEENERVDAATRRNMLFDRAGKHWREEPPATPIVAAGVTSAAPALARMLRVISELPQGAVVLPDLDLSMPDEAWSELGQAGASDTPDGETFGKSDALTHPQYHLKLLLNRMGINREEVQQWHRKGASAAPPERTHAISSLFLPPESSKSWVDLPAEKRRLSGVRLMTSATSDEEAQAIALMVREALEVPEKRVAVVAADRSLARRVVQHLSRWNITADDSAGRPLTLTPAGRFFGLLAEIASNGFDLPSLMGALGHPLVHSANSDDRREWLSQLRRFDRELRGPAPAPGLEPLRAMAQEAGVAEWWAQVEDTLTPITALPEIVPIAQALDALATTAEALAGETVWAREDGRALSSLVEDMRLHASAVGTKLDPADLAAILRDAMDDVAVRPPYGGHPRVAIYGLLESRMARADLVICGGLNEGTWPQPPSPDALLAPPVLRAMGVPGAEFRIGLSAHDLAGALGAPEVVLSRAQRDKDGPTIPSRFLLRAEALLGEQVKDHEESAIPVILPHLDRNVPAAEAYEQPKPKPAPKLRKVRISATALDRLLGDPYQFYAREILKLKKLDPLAADPFSDPALRGTLVHDILDKWHKARVDAPNLAIVPFAERHLREEQVHPLFWGLWRPRILAALERFEQWIDEAAKEGREVLVTEVWGDMTEDGVEVFGRPDRIDRLADGSLAIVDYKTGKPPSAEQVAKGYALQLGVLGMIANAGGFEGINGNAKGFEYWSTGKDDGEFGYTDVPMKVGNKRSGLLPDEFLPRHAERLSEAIEKYINGTAPFTAKENPDYPGYTDYDQLMRLSEWFVGEIETDGEGEG